MRRVDCNVAELARRGGFAAVLSRPAAVSILATDLMAHFAGTTYVAQRVRLFALDCATPAVGGSSLLDDEEGW